MARTTVENTVARIRRQLASGYRNETNVLNGALDSSAQTFPLTYDLTSGVRVGAILCIDTEVMRVVAVNSSAKQVTVLRGYYDSDPAAHANLAEIQLNPRFTPLDIIDAMQEEIASYGPQLYRVDSTEITVAYGDDYVLLPVEWNDCYAIIEARRRLTDSDVTAWPRANVRFQRAGATAVLGKSILRFLDPMPDATLFVRASRPFVLTSFGLTTDLVADVKLPESLLDVVAMGAKLRLLVDNENGRGARTAQDEPRRAEETPVGAMVQPFQFNNAMYRNRKQEEINKLAALYPMAMS